MLQNQPMAVSGLLMGLPGSAEKEALCWPWREGPARRARVGVGVSTTGVAAVGVAGTGVAGVGVAGVGVAASASAVALGGGVASLISWSVARATGFLPPTAFLAGAAEVAAPAVRALVRRTRLLRVADGVLGMHLTLGGWVRGWVWMMRGWVSGFSPPLPSPPPRN